MKKLSLFSLFLIVFSFQFMNIELSHGASNGSLKWSSSSNEKSMSPEPMGDTPKWSDHKASNGNLKALDQGESTYIEDDKAANQRIFHNYITWILVTNPTKQAEKIIKEEYSLESKKEVINLIKGTTRYYQNIAASHSNWAMKMDTAKTSAEYISTGCSIALAVLSPVQSLSKAASIAALKVGFAKAGVGMFQVATTMAYYAAKFEYEASNNPRDKELMDFCDNFKNFLSTTTTIASTGFKSAGECFDTFAAYVSDGWTGGKVLEYFFNPKTGKITTIQKDLSMAMPKIRNAPEPISEKMRDEGKAIFKCKNGEYVQVEYTTKQNIHFINYWLKKSNGGTKIHYRFRVSDWKNISNKESFFTELVGTLFDKETKCMTYDEVKTKVMSYRNQSN